MSGTNDKWGQGLNRKLQAHFAEDNTILKLCFYDIWITLHFQIQKRRSLESLKALAARSVAARVTSEESLTMLELPRSLIKDLVTAHEDPWKTLHGRPVSNKEANLLSLYNFWKFFFPDLPILMILEVLKEKLDVTFYQWGSDQEEVLAIYLKDVMHLLPQMKNMLCNMTNHSVISCSFCGKPDQQYCQTPRITLIIVE